MSAWTCAKTCALSEIASLFQIQVRPKVRYDLTKLNGTKKCIYLVDFFARIEKYCLTAEKTVDKRFHLVLQVLKQICPILGYTEDQC